MYCNDDDLQARIDSFPRQLSDRDKKYIPWEVVVVGVIVWRSGDHSKPMRFATLPR